MTAAERNSMNQTGAKEFALSQIDSCIAAADLTRPPALMLENILSGRLAPRVEAAMATGIRGAASLAFR